MEPLILLGLLGVGGYFLFSSKPAQASSSPSGAAPWSPGAPNPAAFQPWSATVAPPPQGGGQVFDPNLGGSGTPPPYDSSWQVPGEEPALGTVENVPPPTVAGQVGWNPLTKRWY